MSHDDFAFEPTRGLPAVLPKGETLLWQGAPNWKALAIGAYHVRKVAVYFLILLAWRVLSGVNEGHSAAAIATGCLWLLGLGSVALTLLSVLAYWSARVTVYSITNRRVLLRHGIAVQMTMNVPFDLLDSAGVIPRALGTGDLSMGVRKDQRVGYVVTWPHVRPGYFARPQPSFRALADAPQAGAVLQAAMLAYAASGTIRVNGGVTPPLSSATPPLGAALPGLPGAAAGAGRRTATA
jgi:hypothetical protein